MSSLRVFIKHPLLKHNGFDLPTKGEAKEYFSTAGETILTRTTTMLASVLALLNRLTISNNKDTPQH